MVRHKIKNFTSLSTWTRNARALSEVPRREKTKGAPQRNAGALSIRALEGSRWHQGCVGPQVMGFECW